MNHDIKVSVIIPAFNEEDYIEATMKAINKWPIKAEIIIVNDGSTDNTHQVIKELIEAYPIIYIPLEKNLGKGQALMRGIKEIKGDIVMFLDADLGDSAEYAVKLIDPILNKNIDMTIAILPRAKTKGGFGFVKQLAKQGIFLFTGYHSTAPLSGQRALKNSVIREIPGLIDGFGIEVGLTIDVLKRGFQIEEVEIPLTHRETGRNLKGFLHRGKEFMAVLKALALMRKKYRKSY